MKKILYTLLNISIILLFFSACKKDAVIDGGLSDPNINMTTYDWIKSNPRSMFDTTLRVIDKAGMKDIINNAGTFFVPNDYVIGNYITLKQTEVRKKDERLNFTLDSLLNYTPQMLRDSMGIYCFKDKLTRDKLSNPGALYQSNTANVSLWVSLIEASQYIVDGVISTKPKYIYLTKVIGDKDIVESSGLTYDPTNDPKKLDIKVLCQTTGLITTTGIVHVLSNAHNWSFKQQ
ncbi:hypothetical protein [Pedobacter boryungensis]|uniref:FAS1 domain-containing protein n=1 Tax=Pedobacter boryungensis TaxID=869962 RepID=A0ABX2DF08_9SPHI|nr:hypothetical protein [Pedobacter boryungensis]NQX32645.1 hypothetical protein [Pedobacter boryungensis]